MSLGKKWKSTYRNQSGRHSNSRCSGTCGICHPVFSGNWAHDYLYRSISQQIMNESIEEYQSIKEEA